MDSGFFLRSQRLGFRRWTEDYIGLASALWGDADVTRFIGGPFDETQVRERLAREIALQAAHGVQYWPVFLLASGGFIGCCGLRPYDAAARTFELGFHLLPRHWGQGLAHEAARAVIAHAFGELGASALFAGHHPHNAASAKALERLGFHFARLEHYAPTGLMHPSYLLGGPRA